MQLTVEEFRRVVTEEELAFQQTLSIPLFGVMTGSVISLALWGALVWTVWQVIG